jgi:hypothetical protein
MAAISRRSKAMLDSIVMMTELKVGNHKLVTTKQSSSDWRRTSLVPLRQESMPARQNALHLLQQQGPDVDVHRAQGRDHYQRQLHRDMVLATFWEYMKMKRPEGV